MRRAGLLVIGLVLLLLYGAGIAAAEKKPARKPVAEASAKPTLITGKDAIRKALDQTLPSGCELVETPLDDVLEHIGDVLCVHIQLDRKWLANVGIAPDTPVTFNGSGITGRRTLETVLHNLDLTWLVEDEWVLVTTQEDADNRLETALYDVTDLVMRRDEKGRWFEDDDGLTAAITSSISPTSWSEVGGPGSIAALHLPVTAVLVVSQTQRVQEAVEKFLADVRKVEATRRTGRTVPEPTVEEMLRRKAVDTSVVETPSPAVFANPIDPDPDRDALVSATSGFAWKLYQRLADNSPGNVCCSPASIATVLGMAQAGARNQTAELARVLNLVHGANGQQRWDLAAERIPPAFASLVGTLRAQRAANGYDLVVSNRLWAQRGVTFQPAYLDLLEKHFHADAVEVEFGRPDDAGREINDWITKQTSNFLPGRLDPALLTPLTRLLLTNVVYFHGLWANPFEPAATRPDVFYADGGTVQVSMMTQVKPAKYAKVGDLQILEKRYLGDAITITFLLPEDPAALAAVERRLSSELFDNWAAALRSTEVELFLPRFAFQTQYDLKEPLKSLGLATAFDRGQADFSGMDGHRDLFLQLVVHQARIEVDEEGTRAAAVTGGTFGGFGERPQRPTFRANHPFLFVIRDVRTGAILFIGRVARPSPAEPAARG